LFPTRVWVWFRWGWVFLERTQILSGIQFTRHFMEFVFVEAKQFVGTVGFWEVETTVFDPASVFLSTH